MSGRRCLRWGPSRGRFRTEFEDLREGLTDSSLREHLGPFLIRVEKFSLAFVREPQDAERARSLFSPWAAQLDGVRAEPMGRIAGGFDVLQRWVSKRSPDKNLNLAP